MQDYPTLHLGTIAHMTGNPFEREGQLAIYERGGMMVSQAGRITGLGDAAKWSDWQGSIVDHGGAWIIPGCIDGHIHYPQTMVTTAGHGELLDWLENAVFPEEMRFADPVYAEMVANLFVRSLLRSGTTSAVIFGSQFTQATRILISTMAQHGLRGVVGATLMDQGGPEPLLTPVKQVTRMTLELIAECNKHRHIRYAITPRFALSCSDQLLKLCGELFAAHPECHLQTHINENAAEIDSVRAQFPGARSYLDVYDQYGLLDDRTILAHNIHATDRELKRLARSGGAVCHCASSNLYLGSGLFPMQRHMDHGIPVMTGTDVGAGRSFSILEELAQIYFVQKLQGTELSAAHLLYLATLAGARALNAEDIGNLEPGRWADYAVIDPRTDDYLQRRLHTCETPEQRLFALLLQHRSSQLTKTYIGGHQVFPSTKPE